jgi:hypothetical protein
MILVSAMAGVYRPRHPERTVLYLRLLGGALPSRRQENTFFPSSLSDSPLMFIRKREDVEYFLSIFIMPK